MRFWSLSGPLFLLFSMLFAWSCSSSKKSSQAVVLQEIDGSRALANYLTQAEAQKRKQMVSQLEYDIRIHLTASTPAYSGQVKIKLNYQPSDTPLTLDFYQGKIDSLWVNGIKLTNIAYNNYFLTIASQYLKAGENILMIDFHKDYSTNGSGFYKYTDPLDRKNYFYTDFEPYRANSFIPLFDQPDLKAIYRLSVQAPKDFKVITSTRELDKVSHGEDNIWTFRESKLFSTYILSLHAGPYHEWTDRYKNIPLRLYVRQSLKKQVDFNFWFTITKQGFKYFETYFNYPYPFSKYDQVIVPDFNSGAMENVAAVTFAEKFTRDGKQSAEEKEQLANVIMHEMSHMWFGNLVTMKWWNGLWLNESFASFMAVKALYEATAFKQSWLTFFDEDKAWAYYEDDLSTTHPIEGEVNNTDDAFNHFDGITYGKGAAVLKQLSFYLGEEAFRAGMQKYFKQFEYTNTELKDFLHTLAESSGKNLDLWSELWLKSSGFDRVGYNLQCSDNKIKSFFIEEKVQPNKVDSRFHATKIGLYYLGKDQKLTLRHQFDVTFQLKSKVDEMENLPCPDLVWLNQDDHDYVRVVLDGSSLFTIKSSLQSISDPLTRSQLWTALWDMVRDANMKVVDYLDVVKKHLPHEPEIKLRMKVLGTIKDALFYVKDKGELAHWFEEFLIQSFAKTRNDDERMMYFDQLLSIGRSANVQKFWLKSLNAKSSIFDQDRRWDILIALSKNGYMDYLTMLKEEVKKDPSENGRKNFLAGQAIYPNRANKEKWLNAIFDPAEKLNLAQKKVILRHLFPRTQVDLRGNLLHRAYELFTPVTATEENEFMEAFAGRMAPVTCEQYTHNNLVNYMAKTAFHPVLKKPLLMALDEDARCLKIRALNTP